MIYSIFKVHSLILDNVNVYQNLKMKNALYNQVLTAQSFISERMYMGLKHDYLAVPKLKLPTQAGLSLALFQT